MLNLSSRELLLIHSVVTERKLELYRESDLARLSGRIKLANDKAALGNRYHRIAEELWSFATAKRNT